MSKRKKIEWSTLFDEEEEDDEPLVVLFSQRGIKKKKPLFIKKEKPIVVKKEKQEVGLNFPKGNLEPTTLEEYKLSNEDQIFIHRLKNNSMLADPSVGPLPPMVDVLSYVSKLEASVRPPWFATSLNTIVTNGKKYPKLDVLTRAYIAPFLVQCSGDQRPCGQPVCQSEQMGGFRCRELILPDQLASSVVQIQGMCYLCHLAHTNTLFWNALSNSKTIDEREVFCIHRFIVQVNVEGEYRLDKTLMMSDEKPSYVGLFGPFPVFNVNNYKKVQLNNSTLYAWRESDTMVFRQSPEQTESTDITLQEEGKHLIQ